MTKSSKILQIMLRHSMPKKLIRANSVMIIKDIAFRTSDIRAVIRSDTIVGIKVSGDSSLESKVPFSFTFKKSDCRKEFDRIVTQWREYLSQQSD